jgi:hypothetical protein
MANIPRGSKLPQHRWEHLKSHDVLQHFKNKMFTAEQGVTLFTDNPQTLPNKHFKVVEEHGCSAYGVAKYQELLSV